MALILDYPGVRSLSAPVLARAQSINVGGSSLTMISLPQLTTAADLTVEYSSTLRTISMPLLTSLGGGPIDNDTVLATLSLPSLTSGGLSLVNNPVLTSIDVHNLQTGSLQVQMMPVTTFSLPALTTAENLDFVSNAALTSLSFPALTTVDVNGFSIEGSPMLTSVTTPLLTSTGQLYVEGTGLTSLAPFAGLTGALQGDLRVGSNPALTDVTALDGLKSIGRAFDFENNTSLHTASVTALRDTIGVANIHGTITISGNAP